jgi:hypothetical protein
MSTSAGVQRTPLPNGAVTVMQTVRYGELSIAAHYSILPGTSPHVQLQLAKYVAAEYSERLKSHKRRLAADDAEDARTFYERLAAIIATLRAQDLSFAAIAERLNAAGERTRTGAPWTGSRVCSVFQKPK